MLCNLHVQIIRLLAKLIFRYSLKASHRYTKLGYNMLFVHLCFMFLLFLHYFFLQLPFFWCLGIVTEAFPVRLHFIMKNMPIQMYRKFHHLNLKIFKLKTLIFFFYIFAQSIDCGYSLEPPRRGGSNEYYNLCFAAELRNIMYTLVNLSFTK